MLLGSCWLGGALVGAGGGSSCVVRVRWSVVGVRGCMCHVQVVCCGGSGGVLLESGVVFVWGSCCSGGVLWGSRWSGGVLLGGGGEGGREGMLVRWCVAGRGVGILVRWWATRGGGGGGVLVRWCVGGGGGGAGQRGCGREVMLVCYLSF